MQQELNREEQALLNTLRELPPVVPFKSEHMMHSYEPCADCGKFTFAGDFKIFDSGVIPHTLSPLCKACESSFKDEARLVCCTCRMVIGWVKPHVDKDKFRFEKRHSYHIKTCCNCVPGLEKSDIIEKIIYLNKLRKRIV